MSGVWEHTALMWSGLKDARKRQKSLVALWLDLANAYGSVPHKLIEFALRRYGVPPKYIKLLLSYYDGLWSRARTSSTCSSWIRYEVGIFAGCTVAVVLFLAAFNIFLEVVNQLRVAKYRLENGNYLPVLRGFMDDLSAMTVGVKDGDKILAALEKVLAWARMKAKASKSRSCVVKAGRCMDVSPFAICGDPIPSIQKNPVKSLGRVIDGTLTDRKSRKELFLKVKEGLKTIDKCYLSGIQKLFTYQNLFLPRIGWPLMIYEIPFSWVENVEKKVNVFLRKWLGVNRSISNVALFCKDSPCPLPISSLCTDFMKRKVGSLIQLQESSDPHVSQNIPNLYTGRKWKPEKALELARADVRVSNMIGTTPTGRSGLGYGKRKKRKNSFDSPLKKQVSSQISKQQNQLLYAKATQQSLQGKWTRWLNFVQRDMSFNSLFHTSPKLISFCC